MYIKLDYFYFSAFDIEVKVIEILKSILPFLWGEILSRVKDKLSFRKILARKIVLLCTIEKYFLGCMFEIHGLKTATVLLFTEEGKESSHWYELNIVHWFHSIYC